VPGRARSVAAAIAAVLVVAALVLFALFRGGGEPSDEQAIRAWFSSPAGGGAPPDAVRAIDVPACNLTGYRSGSQDVLSCELQTPDLLALGLGSAALRGCFVISNGKVLRGGRQLKANADCKAVRYDRRTNKLIDVETGRHYPIETT
jgi:hypothetical protein